MAEFDRTRYGACKVRPSRARLAGFLRRHGDDLPEEIIKHMTGPENLPHWQTLCEKETGELVAVGHFEELDWFSCAVKGLAVKKEERGKGLGREIARMQVEAAEAHYRYGRPRCLVLAADVTVDNHASRKSLERAGFVVSEPFCYAKGQKPADMPHMVRFKPKEGRCGTP